ncbi:putative ABC transporter [Leptomonas pyrrhocoris]|uniref:Putative ABC transporter n=1 Tax=Leptomonas pyrrhocoris TaxID=157538 RepID=A0A0M9FVY5_LEPPY|nr:putative ABC transporter [Leptomonas pyrrhocoris]XP_015655540.1 putative ABC transporter [Leptomonas pyrrhocoris]XP_015655541.1 putative ABC transporter [Leptomonas pyrrhocoris]XP_015655542.1 putative ABC transporter [Leptomonas pyrrhocoris]KPA77100.1 putative ABC transporter [Leptomonas pyrrhocoris]KPA77101.1 putative ABC transporter [Leptomonas pyrrhocoris]KPA77102.1 putative ABC transporter [Leptomonas pyrrhocoris]KPA77103.1 putative ABC transporter [Leptomonas pyrrhocoris]|eukprot:XP_015655539.1 putative ABC transporter [Leptomonas pyrrhocoris]
MDSGTRPATYGGARHGDDDVYAAQLDGASFGHRDGTPPAGETRLEMTAMPATGRCRESSWHPGGDAAVGASGRVTPFVREPISDGLDTHNTELLSGQSSSSQPTGETRKDPMNATDEFDVYLNAARAQRRYGLADSGRRSSFCWQLGITIKRLLILMAREPSAVVCELIIPIIFVVGSIILWVIIRKKDFPDRQYYGLEGITAMDKAVELQGKAICYNATLTGGTPIADLVECALLISSFPTPPKMICAEDGLSGAPIGLCTVQEAAEATFSALRYIVPNNTTRVPALDELIVLQWATRLLYEAYDIGTVNDRSVESSIFSSGALFFAPASAATTALVSYLTANSRYFAYVYAGTYDTVEAVEEKVRQRTNHDPPNWGIVQVNSLTPSNFDVVLRLNATALPRTNKMFDDYYVGGVVQDGGGCMYTLSGFSTLQKTIYSYYMASVLGMTTMPRQDVLMLPAPTRAYNDQVFLSYGGLFVPLILVLGFLYPVSQMAKRVVLEKELRLREAMLIMGLSETVMYTAWFLIYLVQFAVVSLTITILLKVTYVPKSNFGVIFFLFFFFCLSIITLSGLMAVFFNKARLASILAPLIYFVLAIPLFAMPDSKSGARTGCSFLSPSGLAAGITILFTHELTGGMTGSDLSYFRDTPTMLILLIILFADFLIYLVLMLYLDAVLPKEWGTRKHPLFFLLDPIRWCCRRRSRKQKHVNAEDGRAEDGVFEGIGDDDPSYAIRVMGLRKEYTRGKKKFLAVNNLHWGMREGEISVLLGHNGAGKTTTMNMMTGMVTADAGDCYIYGYSVRDELEKARQEIGYCPQHNILWPTMTCYEHLWYYASVKGLRGAAREYAIYRMLAGVDLEDKRNYRSKNLSGGQKRKLSVAIAFVGGSRLVFLDEPTAGMDVGARRHTWELLRTMSKQHSILLSTHFMDEADLLGDSIAIMSKGRLQCAGSNMFLKAKLGVGYVLTLSVVAHVDRSKVTGVVQEYVPSATQLGSGAGEMGFRLPMSTKSVFPDLLTCIEDHGGELGINAFSVSATTLQEIFIQIAQQEEAKEEALRKSQQTPTAAAGAEAGEATMGTQPPEPRAATSSSAAGDDNNDHGNDEEEDEAVRPSDVWGVSLMTSDREVAYSQFKAMLWKRLWNSLRDRRTQFFQVVCPVLCVLLAMLLMLVKFFQSPPITLTSDLYGTGVGIDVVSCPPAEMNLSIPFSSRATTLQPAAAANTSGLSHYLLDTYNTHSMERYTGLVCSDSSDFASGVSSVIYNTSALHSAGIGLYDLFNGYYMNHNGNGDRQLKTVVSTMPRTNAEDDVVSSVYAMIIAIIIMIPFTFIPSTFVAWIVKEREVKARHLQNVSGLFFSVYWVTNFLFDLCCYVITMFLVIIVFCIFSRKEYVGRTTIGPTIVLFFLYGLSGVAMAYAISFAFKEHSTAQNIVMLANFIAGFLLVLCVSMLSVMDSTKNVAKVLRWFFRVVPSYCVGEGISNLAILKLEQAYGTDKTPWSMSVIGWPCVYMAIEVPFYVFVTLFIDHPGRRQRSQRLFHNPDAAPEQIPDEDEDVIAERSDVLDNPERASDLVRVAALRKVYANGKIAVRNLTFGVHPGEVFGFLGTNGAGKTTTISILCQEFYPTSGHAAVCGNDIVEDSREALRCIGYCPQFDATLDLLTVKEHLELYAGVRAISYKERRRVVKGLLKLCELRDYQHTLAHALSGGNRRKLSVALSLIGGPSVVFLDEPSAGMDPVARRGLWNAIEKVADNSSVVLTTHHLEEVEALAHRVAIMVDGALQCIGNKTHLKQKYATGFEVNVRVQSDSEDVRKGVESFFATRFPGSTLREYRARRFTYELPGTTKLSRTFKLMEEHAEEIAAKDYNVSQTSIEQVFLQISEEAERRHEAEETERLDQADKGCCKCTCCT